MRIVVVVILKNMMMKMLMLMMKITMTITMKVMAIDEDDARKYDDREVTKNASHDKT